MELKYTQKGKVLEQLKVALLSHIPIVYMPTNDREFVKDLIYSPDTHGALIPRLIYTGNDTYQCLNAGEYFRRTAEGTVAAIKDNYYYYPPKETKFENLKVPSLIVLSIDSWKDFNLTSYINSSLGIQKDDKYMQKASADIYHRSLMIVTSAENLPIPQKYAPYIKKIAIPPISDEEIEDTLRVFFSERKVDLSILSDFINEIIISLRGFSTTKIRRTFSEILAKQYILPNHADKEKIIQTIRDEKRSVMEECRGLTWEKNSNNRAVGLDSITKWIDERRDIFKDPHQALKKNIDVPKGVLISGIPGSGKSLMAKTTASRLGLPLISLDMGDLLGGLVGESEHNMINALNMAERMAPCVLWIDEIEKAFSGSKGSSGDSGVGRRMFGKFLTWMQEKSSACFVFATSNDISELPPELFRSERFDKKFFAFMPTVKECAEIFAGIIKKENSTYRKNLDKMSPAEANLLPYYLFDTEVETPGFWIKVLNKGCARRNECLTLEVPEADTNHEDSHKPPKYQWKNKEKPNFKLLTGADISALIKELKFALYKQGGSPRRATQSIYSAEQVSFRAEAILSSPEFKPYGETNVLDIVKCFYRLYINQFVPASGKCILDFDKYLDEDNCYLHVHGSEPEQRYDQALYYLLVGAINYYGAKIKIRNEI